MKTLDKSLSRKFFSIVLSVTLTGSTLLSPVLAQDSPAAQDGDDIQAQATHRRGSILGNGQRSTDPIQQDVLNSMAGIPAAFGPGASRYDTGFVRTQSAHVDGPMVLAFGGPSAPATLGARPQLTAGPAPAATVAAPPPFQSPALVAAPITAQAPGAIAPHTAPKPQQLTRLEKFYHWGQSVPILSDFLHLFSWELSEPTKAGMKAFKEYSDTLHPNHPAPPPDAGWASAIASGLKAAWDSVVGLAFPDRIAAAAKEAADAATHAMDDGVPSHQSSYPLRSNNKVEFYLDGQEAWSHIADDINNADSYIYATFAYLDLDFRPKPGTNDNRTIMEMLSAKAKEGVDVRIVTWSPETKIPDTVKDPNPEEDPNGSKIPGTNGGPGTVQARWDVAASYQGHLWWPSVGGCHHQKTFVMGSKGKNAIAYVGGINAVQAYWDSSAHDMDDTGRIETALQNKEGLSKAMHDTPNLHDWFARIQGPAVQDVRFNFVERYNGATYDHRYENVQDVNYKMIPNDTPAMSGDDVVDVQVLRTIAPEHYHTLPNGERSIRDAYIRAINNAKSFIYFEDQYFYDKPVINAMKAAADRGVKIVGVITAMPDEGTAQGKAELAFEQDDNKKLDPASSHKKHREQINHDNVALYVPGTSKPDESNPGQYRFREIYVHAKTMIVDGKFFTLGSANISNFSMEFHSEMNIAVNNQAKVHEQLRRAVEHMLGESVDDATLDNPNKVFELFKEHGNRNVVAYIQRSGPGGKNFAKSDAFIPQGVGIYPFSYGLNLNTEFNPDGQVKKGELQNKPEQSKVDQLVGKIKEIVGKVVDKKNGDGTN